jgi:hypothetical protein
MSIWSQVKSQDPENVVPFMAESAPGNTAVPQRCGSAPLLSLSSDLKYKRDFACNRDLPLSADPFVTADLLRPWPMIVEGASQSDCFVNSLRIYAALELTIVFVFVVVFRERRV